jgi:alcohol dehydrogenase class IV
MRRKEPALWPAAIVYDVDLTLTCRSVRTVGTAMNALHIAREALYCTATTTTQTSTPSRERDLVAESLPRVVGDPRPRRSHHAPARRLPCRGGFLGRRASRRPRDMQAVGGRYGLLMER